MFSRLGLAALIFISHHPEEVNVNGFAISAKTKNRSNKKQTGGFGKQVDANANVNVDASVPFQHTKDASESTTNLLNFLTSQKAEGLNAGCEIGISDITNMRGMFATTSFKKGEIICKIPSDCVLALSNPELGGADAPTDVHTGRNFLKMYQNDPTASKTWAPYLNTLPTKDERFDATPDFFTTEELDALEFPRSIRMAKERLKGISELSAEDGVDFEELQFATWLVASRKFQISIGLPPQAQADGEAASSNPKPIQQLQVLIPYLDLINHASDDFNAEIHLIDPEKDEAWFSIRATRPIKSGKEITICYGSGMGTSVELLHNYGFIAAENRVDSFMLKKGVDDDECIDSVDGWSTTLAEDEEALKASDLSDAMRKVLEFRCKLKKSYA